MGETILAVDDEVSIRELLRHRLKGEGYSVVTAADGSEAADLLDGDLEPDVAVIDVMMPRLDGKQLARRIRNDELAVRSDLPIVMLTSRGREADVEAGFDIGVDDYVTKPFRSGELLARLRRCAKA